MSMQETGAADLTDGAHSVGDVARRQFLKSAGKYAVVVPPTMTLLLSTTMSSPAIAVSGIGVDNPGGGGDGGGGSSGGGGGSNPGGGGSSNPGGGGGANPGGGGGDNSSGGGGNPGGGGGDNPVVGGGGSTPGGGGGIGSGVGFNPGGGRGGGFGPASGPGPGGSQSVLGAQPAPLDTVSLTPGDVTPASTPGFSASRPGLPPKLSDAILAAGERG